jgi:hypothetical protein
MRRVWRNNGLSLVLAAMFLLSIAGQSLVGHRQNDDDRREHGLPARSYPSYLASDAFLEATMENWESEFLQMAVYVLLSVFLYQKGSAESKDPGKKEEVDRRPDPTRPGAPGPVRRGGVALALYRNSLGLSFAALFVVSFVLHAVGGAGEYNDEQAVPGEAGRVSDRKSAG